MNRRIASLLLGLGVMNPGAAQEFTRGVGVYPGHPGEDFSPILSPDPGYRNLALHRAAYQSSSHDYNATAQLITDGIVTSAPPRRLEVSTSAQGLLPRHLRERVLDQNLVSTLDLKGTRPWIQVDLGSGAAPEVDRVRVIGSVHMAASYVGLENWAFTLSGSEDGRTWRALGQASGMTRRGGEFDAPVDLGPVRHRFYRLDFDDPRAMTWSIEEVGFFAQGRRVPIGGPFDFTSAWMGAGGAQEWVHVDLGAPCAFDRVVLHWIRRPRSGWVQVSPDGIAWKNLVALPSEGQIDDLKLQGSGRFVRIAMDRASSPEGYALSELEVHGRGGPIPHPKAAPAPEPDGRLELAGGAWRVQRASQVEAGGEALSIPGWGGGDWIPATVPGTVLTSYLNAGALPDPNFGDNQLAISDAFFCADFWYRNEFTVPSAPGRQVWMNLDGINWKAEVFFNGTKLGRIEGGFLRRRFDITALVRPGQPNALAVRIERNATPGSTKEKTYQNPDNNGGALGADNPTAHATIGWDWIPTIRGRDIGIWGKVYLSQSGSVTLEDPSVNTALPLPDTSRADVSLGVTVQNHGRETVIGKLQGRFGEIPFEVPVTLEAGASRRLRLDPATVPALRILHPRLWWPTGYGEPHLYAVELKFVAADGAISDTKRLQAGLRQFTARWTPEASDLPDARTLKLWINGRHFIPKGGNWGFPESMLRYRAREYDAALRYHRDMHFNMVRNWVGQTGDDAFFEACDRHGVVVWQDFWLANPWDGPDPNDQTMFMANASDFVRRIRSHASVGLYCGRNEGYPVKPLDDAIRALLKELHADVPYLSSSADDEVSGHGPYAAQPLASYFERPPAKIHSEMGMPNIVSLDSLKLMMPKADFWPQGRVWGLHDFCLGGAQGGTSFLDSIRKNYGEVSNIEEWIALAQFVNYDGHRAMYEAQSQNRLGLLMWMSHPCWPSFVWQTYDYYLEPTAAYFGIKKACEPLHIQWNPKGDAVEVVNYSGGSARGLRATAQILDIQGRVAWEKSATLGSEEDTTQRPMTLLRPAGLSSVYFIRLRLTRGQEVLSENLYCRGMKEGDLQALRALPKVRVGASTTAQRHGGRWVLTTRMKNGSATPVLGVRIKAVRERSGDRILPALYGDNYITLMPGEERTLVTEVEHADTRGETPAIRIEGFNLENR